MTPTSQKTAFVAGAAGAIGRVLCKILIEDGWRVTGTTRSMETAARLKAGGVEPFVVDVFDRDALIAAVIEARPEVVIHQLTDLPKTLEPENMAAARRRNAHIREVGTVNLVAAATEAKARRLIAQSIAFAYAPGLRPYLEDAALDLANSAAVASLEKQVLNCGIEGIVLRYGRLYGPHTWSVIPSGESPIHVDAAADAARRAVTMGVHGTYNIAEDDGTVSCAKAKELLGWSSEFRVSTSQEA